MPADREPPTATDYVVTALSPVLVMLMVGSLVFFLVEVLYAGKYSDKLLYTLFFFVLGAVLVARIAIETDAARAGAYGFILGVVTYIALLAYVEYPGGGWLKSFGWLVNLGLMLLIWWSAHKLTWDCTHIDEKQKGAGRGVLSAAGLDRDSGNGSEKPTLSRDVESSEQGAEADQKIKKPKKAKHESRLWDWIERYKAHRDAKRKAGHTPGVWVIYFALAALPLFALGQSLVAPDDDKRRRAIFFQMAVYVGSALGLLVTTSLLGLRRYLRQRKAKIPTALAGGWLGLGFLLIAVFLVVGAFLPRPHSEVPWFGIERAGKGDRKASKYAVSKSGAGTGEGAKGNQTKAGDGKAGGKNGQPGGGGKGEKGSGGKGQDGKGGSGKKSDQSGGSEKGGGKGQGSETEAKKDRDDDREGGGRGDEEQADGRDEGSDRSGDSPSDTQLGAALDKVAGVLKWVVFAAVAVAVAVAVVLAILRWLAPFTNWAQRLLDALRNFWAGLFGKASPEGERRESEGPAGPVRPPPFHEYSNPFADGSAGGRDPAELVAYTFEALDAWAWDRDLGREPTETPLEFIARVGETFPDLAEVMVQFARVYARVSYSALGPPVNTLTVLEATWEGMVHGVTATV